MDKSYLHTKIAVAGGSFASVAPNLGTDDFLVSGILAMFGASVSFIVSLLLKRFFRKMKYCRTKSKRKNRKNRRNK